MRFIPFLLVPLFLYGGVDCRIDYNPDGSVDVVCWDTGASGDLPGEPGPVLDQEECENLKSEVSSIILSALTDIDRVADFSSAYYTYVIDAQNRVSHIIDDTSLLPSSEQKSSILTNAFELSQDLSQLRYNVSFDDVYAAQVNLRGSLSRLESYVCPSNQLCTSNGSSVDCPCSTEFSNLLTRVNGIYNLVDRVEENTASNLLLVASLSGQIGVLSEGVSNILARLDCPDDRMWGEISDLYSNIAVNVSFIMTNSVDLSSLFYQIRDLIRGDGNEDSKLRLSTEGVVGLNQLVFDMAGFISSQYTSAQFREAVIYFSNTVSSLFRSFNSTIAGNAISDLKWDRIQNVFTNSVLDGYTRYRDLVRTRSAGVTNWFQRMEFYQQGLLGWFDDLTVSPMEINQDTLVESQMKYSFDATTNGLFAVVDVGSNVVESTRSLVQPVVDSLSEVQLVASLPTRILIWPETDLGSFGVIDEVYLDVGEISEYCDVARNATSLFWTLVIWVLYVFVGVGVGRVVFVLVLYVIHFVQNL